MSNAEFRRNYAKYLAKAGGKAETVVRKTALQLQSEMISLSPVDTGRFKGNWVAGVGAVNKSTGDAKDTTPLSQFDPGKSYAATQTVLQAWKPGQMIYLTNSMPYGSVLEYGRADGSPGSKQAPNGMVRLTVQNYSQAVAKAVAEVK